MHIPDSVLSPATSAVAGVAMLPVWAMAGRRVRAGLGAKQVPLLALGAAFCFTIMLFNIPALGGTTAHPVAGTLLAVLLGPWAAVIGVSVALAIQALFFGDGGLLAYGANCFTMAFALPFVGYAAYRGVLGVGRWASGVGCRDYSLLPTPYSLWTAVAAGVGAYIGLNAAAAIVAVLLGIQPALFHEPNGHALYFPFGLKITLPAMLGTHLLIAGPAEAIVTALVARYVQAVGIPLYGQGTEPITQSPNHPTTQLPNTQHPTPTRREPLWIGLLVLMALSPLGLLAKGEAWGEWDAQGLAEQIKQTEGREYVPKGVAQAEQHGYKGLRGLEDYASERGAKGYLFAGLLGAGAVSALLLLGGRALTQKQGVGCRVSGVGDSPMQGTEGEKGRRGEGESPTTQLPNYPITQLPNTQHPTPDTRYPIPDWLCRPAEETALSPDPSGKPPNRFVERTLGEIAAGASATLQGERWAWQSGYLQRIDPRAKIIGLLALIIVAAWVRNAGTLLALVSLTFALACTSRLPLGLLVKRVWLTTPLFVGAIALPAVLNTVTPGHELMVLWKEPHLAVTAPGLGVAALLILRVGVAVSCATLLTLTTPWNDLLRALRLLFVPRLFVTVLAMTYRYLVVLLQTAAEMFLARRSRTVGRATNAEGRRYVGASIGALFGKTLALSEEVHAAMLSRGFQGEMHTLTALRWRAADSAYALAMMLTAILAIGGEYVRFLR